MEEIDDELSAITAISDRIRQRIYMFVVWLKKKERKIVVFVRYNFWLKRLAIDKLFCNEVKELLLRFIIRF